MDSQIHQVEDALLPIFSQLDLDYQMVEHRPVFTIEEAMAAVPPIDGVKTKNVFLRDAKGNRHILVVVPHDRRVDLLALARVLPSTKLSMGSPERLQRHLGVTPGAVSVFSLVNDSAAAVELILDEEIWHAERVQGHPLRNTATVSISHAALATFLSHVGHRAVVMRVPGAP
ncbi:prolyl-tRNA synthetase associated domain-containing protein [Undibacterium arcticum]|uniref:Prolyl-tRNA synthetase associated domain-containing protein n=1 Tax=Undibacterium arcticum TaxID=1762892 RepID=A0ABV7F4Z9_9BURK